MGRGGLGVTQGGGFGDGWKSGVRFPNGGGHIVATGGRADVEVGTLSGRFVCCQWKRSRKAMAELWARITFKWAGTVGGKFGIGP